jgi:hypothetical protein
MTENHGDDREFEDLRHEVTRLQRELEETQRERAGRWRRRLRSVVAVCLIVVGCVLAPIACLTVFIRSIVLNTDEYLAIVGPLPKHEAIASVLADQVTHQLFSHVDVKAEIEHALPRRADFLADPLASTIMSTTRAATYKVVHSDRFYRIWVEANRRVHHVLVGVLTGTGGTAVAADHSGTVHLDLHTLAVNVVRALDAKGITVFNRIPVDKLGGQITLFHAPGLVKVQALTRALNTLAWVLPFVALACFIGAVAVAWRRRQTLLACGFGLAASMGVLAVLVGLARSYLLDAAAGHALTPAAAAVLFDAFLDPPRSWLRILFVIGAVVAVSAWLAGPARPAVALRRGVATAAGRIARSMREKRWHLGTAGRWIGGNEGLVQVGLGVVAFVILVWWGSPGIGGALVVLAVAAALMLAVHEVGQRARRARAR